VSDYQRRAFSFRGFVPPPDHPDYNNDTCSHSHYNHRLGGGDPNPFCWNTWNPDNWGTKWDAYEVEVDSDLGVLDQLARVGTDSTVASVAFQTAWSPPFPVFEKMASLFSDCEFEFQWMNEDCRGAGGGHGSATNGQLAVVDGINDPDNPLWRRMMMDLRGWSYAELQELLDEREAERLADEEAERLADEAAASELP